MKNKKLLIAVISILLVAVIITGVVMITYNGEEAEPVGNTGTTTGVGQITVPGISGTSTSATTGQTESTDIEPDGSGLTLPPVDPTTDTTSQTTNKVEQPAKPVSEAPTPLPTEPKPTGHGIIIGDGGKTEPYHCGVEGHHCDGPETHTFIQNLELEGCSICGSHSCPSFYATNEWGFARYTPSECPQYDIYKDPVYYCQTCGKRCGDGTNGTCCIFVVDTDCPLCHQAAKAWECHYCNG